MTITSIKNHYQDEAVARSYDRERFAGPVGRCFDALEKRALSKALVVVQREIKDPKTLDVPCGTGRVTELLLDRGLEVTGGDIAVQMMDVARAKCARHGEHVTFCRLDLDDLDLANASFDLVTCIRLFHHLDSAVRERILGELSRVSRRYVVVNVSYSSPFYRWRRRFKRFLGQGVSRTSSTWSEITREASSAGLRIVATRYVMRLLSEDLIVILEKI